MNGTLLDSAFSDGHGIVTVLIFALTLVLILKKPWDMHEAWATSIGGALMLVCGSLSPKQAIKTVADGLDVMVFLLALMLLSALLDRAGFFEWCALHAARAARGNGRVLYRNVFLVGAAITAFLSLDTTAIILTPIVVSFVQKLKLKAHPFLIACAFVANTGSLLLPVSNLTNLLFQHSFAIPFVAFTAHMVLPQIIAVALNYWLFVWLFGRSLPKSFEQDLPLPQTVIENKTFFRLALAVLIFVLIGYFVASLFSIPPYAVALSGSAMLAIAGFTLKRLDWRQLAGQVSWELFPFVVGLFIVIRGVENLGLARVVAHALSQVDHHTFPQILATAFATGLGSNIVNNIPMALLAISVLREAHNVSNTAIFAAILGCNIGPNLTIAGSLATMLVISAARKRGEQIGAWEFFKTGAIVTPLILLASCGALWLSIQILGGSKQ